MLSMVALSLIKMVIKRVFCMCSQSTQINDLPITTIKGQANDFGLVRQAKNFEGDVKKKNLRRLIT
jgi:hypothetical protein